MTGEEHHVETSVVDQFADEDDIGLTVLDEQVRANDRRLAAGQFSSLMYILHRQRSGFDRENDFYGQG